MSIQELNAAIEVAESAQEINELLALGSTLYPADETKGFGGNWWDGYQGIFPIP